MGYDAKAYIDGEWIDGAERGDNLSPYNGEKLGTYAKLTKQDTLNAITAAKKAFPAWRACDGCSSRCTGPTSSNAIARL